MDRVWSSFSVGRNTNGPRLQIIRRLFGNRGFCGSFRLLIPCSKPIRSSLFGAPLPERNSAIRRGGRRGGDQSSLVVFTDAVAMLPIPTVGRFVFCMVLCGVMTGRIPYKNHEVRCVPCVRYNRPRCLKQLQQYLYYCGRNFSDGFQTGK